MFSTPLGFSNNSIIFAKCGREQIFLLGKIVTDLKRQKEGTERKAGDKKKGRYVGEGKRWRHNSETESRRWRRPGGKRWDVKATREGP